MRDGFDLRLGVGQLAVVGAAALVLLIVAFLLGVSVGKGLGRAPVSAAPVPVGDERFTFFEALAAPAGAAEPARERLRTPVGPEGGEPMGTRPAPPAIRDRGTATEKRTPSAVTAGGLPPGETGKRRLSFAESAREGAKARAAEARPPRAAAHPLPPSEAALHGGPGLLGRYLAPADEVRAPGSAAAERTVAQAPLPEHSVQPEAAQEPRSGPASRPGAPGEKPAAAGDLTAPRVLPLPTSEPPQAAPRVAPLAPATATSPVPSLAVPPAAPAAAPSVATPRPAAPTLLPRPEASKAAAAPSQGAAQPASDPAGTPRAAAALAAGAPLFTVQVGAFRTLEAAERLAARLAGKGYPVFVASVDLGPAGQGIWHRVRVGRFESRGAAEVIAGRLAAAEGLSAQVVREPAVPEPVRGVDTMGSAR